MPAIFIETMDQFRAKRHELEPVYINSKTHGAVLVPCVNTILVRTELAVANLYNPNFVSDEKMALLRQSILDNGFCFPVVAIWDEELDRFVIVDGFHRRTIGGTDWLDFDYIPVVVLNHTMAQRMTATIQFNKARGVHQVDLDAEVIASLLKQGLTEEEIAIKLGIDTDTVHRYKQTTGYAELFAKADYSMAWEMVDDAD